MFGVVVTHPIMILRRSSNGNLTSYMTAAMDFLATRVSSDYCNCVLFHMLSLSRLCFCSVHVKVVSKQQ